MFGFGTPAAAVKTSKLDDVMARHKANIAAERAPPTRTDTPSPIARKKVGFGKRRG